jgi:putative ribosome biogenesis GTPase RsgA
MKRKGNFQEKCYYNEKCLNKSKEGYCNFKENCNQKGINYERILRQLKILKNLKR